MDKISWKQKVNISIAKLLWKGIQNIGKYKDENPKIMKVIYCEIIFPILLYCSETWFITERINNYWKYPITR